MSANQSAEVIYQGINVAETMQFTSIYIPNLPEDLMLSGRNISNENDLAYLFEHQFPLGVVKRVDIATRPHRNGGHVRCAFVHFEEWLPFAGRLRMALAAGGEQRLYGPTPYAPFYSSINRGFERFITLKMNKAPIEEVAALDAEQMNVHQLVDNYKRLDKQLAEKDAKIAELEKYVKHLQNVSAKHLQMLQSLEYEVMVSRRDADDFGNTSSPRDYYGIEEPADGGPMTLDELSIQENAV